MGKKIKNLKEENLISKILLLEINNFKDGIISKHVTIIPSLNHHLKTL